MKRAGFRVIDLVLTGLAAALIGWGIGHHLTPPKDKP